MRLARETYIPKEIKARLMKAGVNPEYTYTKVLFISESATFICFDRKTGAEYWVSRNSKTVFIV